MDYILHIVTLSAIYAIAALGQNYASGYTGLISLNHGAFLGIGAYTGAIFLKVLGFSYPMAFLAAGFLTALIALIVSFPLLRLRDDSFVLVSFGVSFVVFNILLNWRSVTNGALGIKGIPSPALFENAKVSLFIVVVVVLLLVLLALYRILQSSYGVVIKATRENMKITQIAGHDTDSYRRSVFVLSAFITGVAGLFLASFISSIDPTLFSYHRSVFLLVVVVLGGLASLKGSVIGAFILLLIPEFLRFLGLPNDILAESIQIIYGFVLIGLMVYRPIGLFGKYRI